MVKLYEIDDGRRKLFRLEKKAIKLQREVLKILDKIYETDEVFGEAVNEELKDETFLRSKVINELYG